MTCAACQANITRNVGKLDGVEEVNVSLLANQMTVAYDEEKIDEQAIIHAVTEIGSWRIRHRNGSPKGQRIRGKEWQSRREMTEENQKEMKRRLITSVAILIPLMYVAMGPMMSLPVPGFLVGMENSPDIRFDPAAVNDSGNDHQSPFLPVRF